MVSVIQWEASPACFQETERDSMRASHPGGNQPGSSRRIDLRPGSILHLHSAVQFSFRSGAKTLFHQRSPGGRARVAQLFTPGFDITGTWGVHTKHRALTFYVKS